jgi:hypothetical protein
MKIHSLLAVLALASLHAQPAPAADPYVKDPSQSSGKPPGIVPRNLSVCCETFSVPLAFAARLQRERKTDAELYTLLGGAAAKDGARQESFDIALCKSGTRAIGGNVIEYIYPTEFKPPSLPTAVGIAITPSFGKEHPASAPAPGTRKDAPSSGLFTPATPSSFDTRNVGRDFEAEATMGEDPQDPFVDLRIYLGRVAHAGTRASGQGISQIEMPVFESQRVNTAVTVRAGQPALLGTFNRPPVSQVDPDSAKRVWFAFVTVKAVKP